MSKFQLIVLAVLMAALGMTCTRSSGEGGEPKPASPVAPAELGVVPPCHLPVSDVHSLPKA